MPPLSFACAGHPDPLDQMKDNGQAASCRIAAFDLVALLISGLWQLVECQWCPHLFPATYQTGNPEYNRDDQLKALERWPFDHGWGFLDKTGSGVLNILHVSQYHP